MTTPRAPNSGSMPAYDTKLSDQQFADVTNYIRNSWGNAAPAVTPAQVAAARKTWSRPVMIVTTPVRCLLEPSGDRR